MDVEMEEQGRETDNDNKVMCQLSDPEGNSLEGLIYLPQNAGPKQLQQIVNQRLNNVNFCFYTFFYYHKILSWELFCFDGRWLAEWVNGVFFWWGGVLMTGLDCVSLCFESQVAVQWNEDWGERRALVGTCIVCWGFTILWAMLGGESYSLLEEEWKRNWIEWIQEWDKELWWQYVCLFELMDGQLVYGFIKLNSLSIISAGKGTKNINQLFRMEINYSILWPLPQKELNDSWSLNRCVCLPI